MHIPKPPIKFNKSAMIVFIFWFTLSSCQSNSQAENGEENQGNGTPATIPEFIDPTPTEEPQNYLYSGFTDLLEENVEKGIWTQGQGLVQLLKLFAGEITSADIDGVELVREGEGTMLIALANEYLLNGEEQEKKVELERLVRLIFPTQDQLDRFSQPYEEGSVFGGGKMAAPANQVPEDCESMWRDGFVNENFPCFVRKEASVNGQTYGVYIPAAMQESAHFDAALEAMVKAAQEYSKYGKIQDATVLFSMLGSTIAAASTNIEFNVNSDPCPIVVYSATVPNTSIDVFQQAMAHEMFHCFQKWNAGADIGYEPHTWWIEGSAEYFSNLVYPRTNIEHRFLGDLDAKSTRKSLVELSYENFLFFQYLGNNIFPQGVVNMLIAIGNSGFGHSSHMEKVQEFSGDENIYQSFGKAFIDGTIADSDSSLYPKSSKYTKKISINSLTQESFETAPFVLTRILLTYEVRMHFEQQVFMEDPGLHTVRKLSKPGEWDSLKERIYTFCSENKIIVLVTNEDMGSGTKALHLNVFKTSDKMWNLDIGLGEEINGKSATFSPVPAGAGLYNLIFTEDPTGSNQTELNIFRVSTFSPIWGGYFDLNSDAWDVMASVNITEQTENFMQGIFSADFYIKDSFEIAFSGMGTFGACTPSELR